MMIAYGDIIIVSLQARGQKRKIGWFPANYVKILSSSTSARSTPDTSGQKALNVPGSTTSLSASPLPVCRTMYSSTVLLWMWNNLLKCVLSAVI